MIIGAVSVVVTHVELGVREEIPVQGGYRGLWRIWQFRTRCRDVVNKIRQVFFDVRRGVSLTEIFSDFSSFCPSTLHVEKYDCGKISKTVVENLSRYVARDEIFSDGSETAKIRGEI